MCLFNSLDQNLWEEAKQKARDERQSEFAPPSAYFESSQQGHRKATNVQSHDQQSKSEQPSSSRSSMSYAEKVLQSAEFPSYVPRGEFQSYQSTNRTTHQGLAEQSNKPYVSSPSATAGMYSTAAGATLSASASSSEVAGTFNARKVKQKESRTAIDEDSINKSLLFFRKQSEKN